MTTERDRQLLWLGGLFVGGVLAFGLFGGLVGAGGGVDRTPTRELLHPAFATRGFHQQIDRANARIRRANAGRRSR